MQSASAVGLAVERTFGPEAVSVSQARHFLLDELDAWGLSSLSASAALALSELATNALLHAGTPFTVAAVKLPDGALRLAVADRVRRLPRQRDYGTQATTGRGVALVASLSRAWGVDRQPDGKSVWCEIEAPVDVFAGDVDLDSFLSDEDRDLASTSVPAGITSLDRAAGW